jgi:uncharacterized protein YegP (UPF0339 family)
MTKFPTKLDPKKRLEYHLVVSKPDYRDWYWHVIAPNGRLIADGAEGYKKRSGAIRAAQRFIAVATEGLLVLKVEDFSRKIV